MVGLAASLLLAVLGPRAHAKPEAVTLQLKWQHQFQFAGYYAAQARGYFRQAGLDVTFIEADDYAEPLEAVLGGRADFGIAGSDLVLARAEGLPVVALAALFQHSPLVLLARADGPHDHLHAFAGRRLMLESHSAELRAYLRDEGIPVEGWIRHPTSSIRPL